MRISHEKLRTGYHLHTSTGMPLTEACEAIDLVVKAARGDLNSDVKARAATREIMPRRAVIPLKTPLIQRTLADLNDQRLINDLKL